MVRFVLALGLTSICACLSLPPAPSGQTPGAAGDTDAGDTSSVDVTEGDTEVALDVDAEPDAAEAEVPTVGDSGDSGDVGAITPPRVMELQLGGHSCALMKDRSVWCWGANDLQQMGRSSFALMLPPGPVQLPPVAELRVGAVNTCALTVEGQVWCWGSNGSKECGIPAPEEVGQPTLVPLGEDALHLDVGDTTACVILEGDRVACWGSRMTGDQWHPANGAPFKGHEPLEIEGFSADLPPEKLAVGTNTACVAAAEGRKIACFGSDFYQELGDGPGDGSSPSAAVIWTAEGEERVLDLDGGRDHFCAVIGEGGSGEVWCWGENYSGQAGQSDYDSQVSAPTPLAVQPQDPVLRIGAGLWFTCARTIVGQVECWGENKWSNLGIVGAKTYTPKQVPELVAEDVSVGVTFVCALRPDGEVVCWGDGSQGNLGGGVSIPNTTEPQTVVFQ